MSEMNDVPAVPMPATDDLDSNANTAASSTRSALVCDTATHHVEAPSTPLRILVVDDEPSINRLYSMRFRREIADGEWEFLFVHNGIEALEVLRTHEDILVVLVDLNMPQMDGLTFLARLEELNLATRAVVVSAYGDMENIRAAMNCGAFDFLGKPIDFDDVAVTIRKTVKSVAELRLSRRAEEFRVAKDAAELNLKRLQELEDLRHCLTNMIVHDLRTPMTAYMGGLEVMQMRGEMSAHQRECLAISLRGGATLVAMISDMLDISKMEAGLLRLEVETFQPRDLIERVILQIAPLVERCGLTLKNEIAADLPLLRADEDKLQRALLNLLSNCIKFTPDGGSVVLATFLSDDDQNLIFTVSDIGFGILPEEHGLVFEKYGQIEGFRRERKMMSSGLSLTFCKMVAEAHGGRIWVESQHESSSHFILTIPLISQTSGMQTTNNSL